MVYTKDFRSKDEEYHIYKLHLKAINKNPNLLENHDIEATLKSVK